MSLTPPKDPYELLQWNMIHAHNTFKLGYNTIREHLESPPENDLANFFGYCESWAASIHEHHESEESLVFPTLQPRIDFSRQIEQHKTVHAGLDALFACLVRSRADLKAFDPTELKQTMQNLKAPLFEHLDEEVEHIAPTNMRAAGFTEEELRKLDAELETYARAHGDPFLMVPFMRSHTPPELKETWPIMPWVLRKVLIPYVIAMRHYGYWKYAPYAMS